MLAVLMAAAFAGARDAMVVMNQSLRIVEANTAFLELAGLPAAAVTGMEFSDFLRMPPETVDWRDAVDGGLRESTFHGALGIGIPIEVDLHRTAPVAGGPSYLIATVRDITERCRAEAALARLALYDALTGLPNRAALQQRLGLSLRTVSDAAPLAVMFLDIDGFKELNDSLGHAAGDEMLRVMAQRLSERILPQDMLARWGGDEFVVVLDLQDREREAETVAYDLLATMRSGFDLRGHAISLSASIGVAMAPIDGLDVDELLRHADAAMYVAKHAGKNRVVSYQARFGADALQRMLLVGQLRIAIETEDDALHFAAQPKFDRRLRVIGVELLARWNPAMTGSVSPAVFIPMAETNGMALALGRLAIRQAARFAAMLQERGWAVPVAVNISALQVMDERLQAVLDSACADFGIAPRLLELEVTESVFLQDSDVPEQCLTALRSVGHPIAMDDFGTGYSSLSYLRRLPFDTVKIDRAFLVDVDRDDRARRLLSGIVNMCRSLRMHTVAEGVETAEQLELLRGLGVDQFQGFLLARPMTQPQLLDFLRTQTATARAPGA